jgi:AraC family transcriptional regulator, transcriptional activator of pobA
MTSPSKSEHPTRAPAVVKSLAIQKGIQVPAFFLFGEPYKEDVYAFLHAEKLEIRNAEIGWNIPLHVHPDFDQLSILLTGHCEYEHDGMVSVVQAPSCVFTRAGTIHRFSYKPGSDGFVVSVSPDIVDGLGSTSSGVSRAYLRLAAARTFTINDPRGCTSIQQLLASLSSHVSAYHENYRDLTRHLFAALLLELEVFAVSSERGNPRKGNLQAVQMFDRYQNLISEEIRQLGVSKMKMRFPPTTLNFAEELSTTPHLLNTACKLVAGVSARDLIQDAVLYQACQLLLYTQLSIKEISYLLGYSHPSHFVRFFKAHRRSPPHEFRRGLQKGD